MEHAELRDLFARYMEGALNPGEYERLADAAQTLTVNAWQKILTPLIENTAATEAFDEQEWKEIIEHIIQQPVSKQAKTITMRWWLRRIAVAAIIILVVGAGSYFLFFNHAKENEIAKKEVKQDVPAPGLAKATLKLGDGTIVYLDKVKNGSLAMQGNVNVVKLADGQITYTGTGKEVMYNTLTNPRGSKVVNLTLSDGTKVWLNSESSLRYPIAFTGNERIVEITGEAYFEAAHDPTKPFIVKKGDVQVQVLGTHFNMNTYEDEETTKVTLSEGLVKVKNEKNTQLLSPGQQAQIKTNGQITLDRNADVEQVTAWKNGLFSFKGADIKAVMRQLLRWYDMTVEYKGEIREKFHVEMDRNTNVSNVFKILETTGGVHFSIDGKKITVMP